MRHVIQRQVENQVSKRLLAGEFGEGDTVHADHTPGAMPFETQPIDEFIEVELLWHRIHHRDHRAYS
ncbi:MAG: hypothetical protein AB7R89_03045 [Dehalococcoidia bacterium]